MWMAEMSSNRNQCNGNQISGFNKQERLATIIEAFHKARTPSRETLLTNWPGVARHNIITQILKTCAKIGPKSPSRNAYHILRAQSAKFKARKSEA